MSQMGLAQKVLKFAFLQLFSRVHAQSPATFYWLKRVAWSRDQVRVLPLLESSGEKHVDS
jgi:hypothetical protein